MKKFKEADAWVSTALIIASIIMSLLNLDETFIYCYFIVGTWQVISMVVHEAARYLTAHGSSRRKYHLAVLALILLITLSASFNLGGLLMLILFPLLFLAPVMAILYTRLCFRELKRMHRPIEILK